MDPTTGRKSEILATGVADRPRRRMVDELRGSAVTMGVFGAGALVGELATSAGRSRWADSPAGVALPAVALIAARVVLPVWFARDLRRRPADPHPGAPIAPAPSLLTARLGLVVAFGVAWGGCVRRLWTRSSRGRSSRWRCCS